MLLVAVFVVLMLFTQVFAVAFAQAHTPTTTQPEGNTASQEEIAKAFRVLQGVGEGVNNGEGGSAALQEACALLTPIGKTTLDKLSGGLPHVDVGRVCAQMNGSSGSTGSAVMEGMASDMLAGSLLPYAHESGLPYLSHVEIEGGLIGGHAGSSVTTVQPFYENRAAGDFVFNQLSWQHQVGITDDGNPDDTLNAGFAYRSLLFDEKLLVGSNVFFDHQLDQGHERMSVGVDARTSLYGFASNYYVPLSEWKSLNSLYEARAVSGMDMEFSGQLEELPEWTLFAKGFTWDAGINARTWGYDTNLEWSPVPALVFTTGIRDELGSTPSVNASVRLRLNLGQSAAENFSPRKTSLASVADHVWSKVRRENTIRTIQRKKASTGLQVLETSGANDADTDEGRISLSAGLSFNMPATLHISDTAGAMARLQLADGGSLTLGQGTEVRITTGLVTLVTGLAHYVSGTTDVAVDIPGGHIALLGTDIDVRSVGGASTVRVRDGGVRLTGTASGSVELTNLNMGQVTGGVASAVAEGSATYTTHADTVSTTMDWISSGLTGAKVAPYLTAAPFIETNAHIPGETLRIALSFNAPVTVAGGVPSLSLQVGSQTRTATLLSGSGSGTLIFGYVLQAADAGVSAVTVTGFNANAATISGDGKAAVIGIAETQLQLSGTIADATAPSGYAVAFTTSPINGANETAAAFQITSAEVGATYNYTISSSGGGTNVTGSGTIATATQNVTGINVSGLGNGTLTVSLTLTDASSNTGGSVTNTVVKSTDATAPSGYAIAFTTSPITSGNQTAAAFQITSAEVGATYNYTISSSGGGTNVTGSGTIATATQNVTGINVSGLGNGTLTVSLTLTDASSNTGSAATNTVVKDTTAPSGYAVAFTTSPINAGNQTAAAFQITSAEVGATYNYTISSSGGGTNVTGSGTIATATQNVTGIDVSGLGNGTLTVSLTLTDASSNTGSAATNTVVKDTTAPSGYAAAFTTSPINAGNQTAAAFQITSAEVGATYNYTISSSGGGTNVTGSGTIATATQNVTGINVSGLGNGTLTVSLTLTDASSNTGSAATNTVVKDTTAPSGYAVAFTTSPINAGNQTAAAFQITSAEVGTTYNYTISSSGGGTNVTGSGTIATATQNVTGIDVSGLGDGTLTVSLTLTDTASNTGAAATNTVVKNVSDACSGSPSVGTVCADGTVYAGLSPDGSVPMYVTRCDMGQTWNGSACTGTRTTKTWNDGTTNWLDTPLANCSAATGTSPPVGTGTCITGKSNSTYLLTADSATTTGGVDPHNAAIACENLVEDGHSDWYLPGLNELYLLYVGRASISGLDTSGNWYWSSSEYDSNYAWLVRFSDGYQYPTFLKNYPTYLRCSRR